MNAILIRNSHTQRFDLVDPSPRSEEDFEKTVIGVLAEIYPECWVVPFKPTIQHLGVGWRPDLAMVHKQCRYWFVLEVEVATHSLQKHVLPQVTAFKQGAFEGAEAALAKALSMPVGQAATLLQYVPRYVGVVSNQHDLEWQAQLTSQNVQFVSISEFAGSSSDRHALLVAGRFIAGEQSIGFARVYASQQAIVTNASGWVDGEEYVIESPDGVNTWVCTLDQGKAWLVKKNGIIRLAEESIVQVIKDEERLFLRVIVN